MMNSEAGIEDYETLTKEEGGEEKREGGEEEKRKECQ